MSISDLGALLRATPIPAPAFAGLSAFTLDSVHWDERGDAVTAAFEGPLDAVGRAALEAAPEHDWVRFYLRFGRVSDFEVLRWSHEPAERFEYVPDGQRVAVTMTGPGSEVRFTSDPAVVVQHRTSRAAPI